MSDRAWRTAVALVLGLALVARAGLIVAQPDFEPVGDAAAFDQHAVSIAQEGRYPPSDFPAGGGPAAFRPPAYPHLLAAAYAVTGTADDEARHTVGRALGALLGVAAVALVGAIAAMLWGRLVAACAMALAAVYPTLVAVSVALLSEALFIALVLGAVACVLVQRRSPAATRWAVAAGAMAGAAALTRTNGAVVIPALAAGLWALPGRPRLLAAGALVGAFAAVCAPWVIRNASVFGEPTLTTQSGFTLAGTYNDEARADASNPASWRASVAPPYEEVLERRDRDEAETDRELRSRALEYMRDHPGYVAKVGAWNTLRMAELTGRAREHLGARETGVGRGFSDAGRFAFWLVAAAAAVGVVALHAARRAPAFVWAVPLLLYASIVFVNSSARYRVPVDPFLLLLAAPALAAAAGRFGRGAKVSA